MRTHNVSTSSDTATAVLARWTTARRDLERDDLSRELLAELRRLRGELAAFRLALERRAV